MLFIQEKKPKLNIQFDSVTEAILFSTQWTLSTLHLVEFSITSTGLSHAAFLVYKDVIRI